MNIGIAGTGRMGTAIAQRLLALGHAVSVWNRTRAKAEALADRDCVVLPVRWARKVRTDPG